MDPIRAQTKRIAPDDLTLDPAREGAFRATFSTFNCVDLDGDITLPGAFTSGEKVRIAQWGHAWHMLPVGRGVIDHNEQRAWVDGQFLLTTQAGRDTYETVKELGELQEWSYGFDILAWSVRPLAEDNPEQARFLEHLRVIEVSPVMLGAGIDTRTDAIKTLLAHDGSLAGHSEAVLAAAGELANRLRLLADLRAKEGRVLSEVNRRRIKEQAAIARDIADDLDELFDLTAPRAAGVAPALVRRAWLDLVRLELDEFNLIVS